MVQGYILQHRVDDPWILWILVRATCALSLVYAKLNICTDSPAFDPKAYYEQLITTSSLTALLKKENELLTGELVSLASNHLVLTFWKDMRQLDSERQSLVYNHHHELIAATDTISAVSSGVWSEYGSH